MSGVVKRLTPREKNAIRAMPCGKCGAVPPFPDGSRCHPHRIVPKKGYVEGNVVPMCPDCHAREHGQPRIKGAYKGGRKGGLRTNELHPEMAREAGRKGIRRAWETSPEKMREGQRKGASKGGRRARELHPELAREAGRKGGRRAHELHPELARENMRRLRELHPEKMREAASKGGLKTGSKNMRRMNELHPETVREAGRKGRHVRWHVRRGIVNPDCALCAADQRTERGETT